MKKIIIMKFLVVTSIIAITGSCKKSNPASNSANTTTDHGYVIFNDTTYQFQYYNGSTINDTLYVQPASDYYPNSYAYVMGMRFSPKPIGSGSIALTNATGKNFVDLVVHNTPILNDGTYHNYCKAGETIEYSYSNNKLRITGTNLTETDEFGTVIPGGHPVSFVSQE